MNKKKKCPLCGSKAFYVKDPDDPYETYEFECKDGEICFDPEMESSDPPEIQENTETFCNKCSWHDRFDKLEDTN